MTIFYDLLKSYTVSLLDNNNNGELDKRVDCTFTFAFVRFFKQYPDNITTFRSINSEVYQNTFEDETGLCILPVHAIHSPVGVLFEKLSNMNIIVNLPRKINE
jgi:hypothetical protein